MTEEEDGLLGHVTWLFGLAEGSVSFQFLVILTVIDVGQLGREDYVERGQWALLVSVGKFVDSFDANLRRQLDQMDQGFLAVRPELVHGWSIWKLAAAHHKLVTSMQPNRQ